MKHRSQDTSTLYYYAEVEGRQSGPLPINTIYAAQLAGRLTKDVMISRQAGGPWIPLSRIYALVDLPMPVRPERAENEFSPMNHPYSGTHLLIAIVLPFFGVILGMIFLSKDDPHDRALGSQTMVTSVLVIVLVSIAWFMIFQLK